MKMIHHQELNGTEITIVVQMMPYLLFCLTYEQQNRKNGKNIGFQKYLRGVSTLEAAHNSLQALLNENDPVLFPSRHTGCYESSKD
jgi:hypothetical protein